MNYLNSKYIIDILSIEHIINEVYNKLIKINNLKDKENIFNIIRKIREQISLVNSIEHINIGIDIYRIYKELIANLDMLDLTLSLEEYTNTDFNHIELRYIKNDIRKARDILLNSDNTTNKQKSNIEKESSLEVELASNKDEIKILEERLKNSSQNKQQLEEEKKGLEKVNEKLEKKLKKLQSNEEKVEETIGFIDKLPTEHLGNLKNNLVKRIKFFNIIGTTSLVFTLITFLGYLGALILNLPAPTTGVSYFTNVFFIVFPTIVAFTAFRQSNLKSKELEKIDEKLLNSNYLVASLKAIQKISSEGDTNKEVLMSINKIVDSILKVSNDDKEIGLSPSQLSTILKNVSSVTKT
jgi:hypothetical protein